MLKPGLTPGPLDHTDGVGLDTGVFRRVAPMRLGLRTTGTDSWRDKDAPSKLTWLTFTDLNGQETQFILSICSFSSFFFKIKF